MLWCPLWAPGAASPSRRSSRICRKIDQQDQAFLIRPLQESGYTYAYLDDTYLKGRLGEVLQVCSRAVGAMGVNADGSRELLGLKVGDSENEAFWSEFISSLKERCLAGVRLVISDAHVGLTKAIRTQLQGYVWQGCRSISAGICCSGCPGPTMAWSRPPCAACSPRKAPPTSSATGTTWSPRWLSASPRRRSS